MPSSNYASWVVLILLGLQISSCHNKLDTTTKEAQVEPDEHNGESTTRPSYRLPTLLDFNLYQKLYRKSYKSASESTLRLALYLARCYRVCVSAIQYKHRRSSYYLAINVRSDWTPQEIDSIQNPLVEPIGGAGGIESYYYWPPEFEPRDEAHSEDADENDDDDDEEVGEEWPSHQGLGQAPPRATNFEYLLPDTGLIGAQAPSSLARFGLSSEPDYKPLNSQTIAQGTSRQYGSLPNAERLRQQERSDRKLFKSRRVAKWSRVSLRTARNLISGSLTSRKVYEDQDRRKRNLASQHKINRNNDDDVVWVDHRRSGCLAEIQDQGMCGACYIFASIAYLEWAHCRATGQLVKFSEQYLVDCGSQVSGLNGCSHGLVTQVGVFVNNFGLERTRDYANGRGFSAREGQCPYAPSAPLSSLAPGLRLNMASLTRVPLEYLEDVLADAPLIVNIGTSRELYEYGGGVFSGVECSRSGHHSVLIIGHGRENGEEYWLIRNSESVAYGESGHLRLNKNSQCIMPQMGFMFGQYLRDEHRVRIFQ